ncbi:putative integral membrane protein (TIGR02327 family) [Laceyella sacchari]|jgi:uncharacterized integral membrane protein (TIGR02327 family)|nr:putative integral membrane protein (TIGR02327 family) [Laceyella sacchari]
MIPCAEPAIGGVHKMNGVGQLAMESLVNILISLGSIVFCWWILTGVRWDVLIRPNRVMQARLLLSVVSIVLGHGLASFVIDYLGWSRLVGTLLR